jgi:putative endonuclease
MFFVYCLSSLSRNYLYVGLTDNLERRFSEHQSGKNHTTKPYRPFEIIFSEIFKTRKEARNKEKYLKSGVGKEFLKTITKNNSPVGETCLPAGW